MSTNGILVDIEWCTGCHSCEMACQTIKDLPIGQFGIKITEIGPYQRADDNTWMYLNIPTITKQCDLCSNRVEMDMEPMCVKHCQAQCMTYGAIDELAKEMTKKPYSILLSAK